MAVRNRIDMALTNLVGEFPTLAAHIESQASGLYQKEQYLHVGSTDGIVTAGALPASTTPALTGLWRYSVDVCPDSPQQAYEEAARCAGMIVAEDYIPKNYDGTTLKTDAAQRTPNLLPHPAVRIAPTRDAIGTIRAQAEALGTVGGPAMLERQIAGLGGVLEHFAVRSDDARNRLTALVAVLGRGLPPSIAARVQSQTLGSLESSALDINRTLGRDILDENGNVGDPAGVLRDLQRSMQRRGLSERRQLLAWRRYLGTQAGSRVFHAMQSGELSDDALAHLSGLSPSRTGADAAEAFRTSGPGERIGVQLANERAAREAAEGVLDELRRERPDLVGVIPDEGDAVVAWRAAREFRASGSGR